MLIGRQEEYTYWTQAARILPGTLSYYREIWSQQPLEAQSTVQALSHLNQSGREAISDN